MKNAIANNLRAIRSFLRSINPLKFTRFDQYFIAPACKPATAGCRPHSEDAIHKDNVVLYISSRNNYEMLAGELLNNNELSKFLTFNIDDNSSPEQLKLGKEICRQNNIVFLKNTKAGLQWGLKTLVDYLDSNNYAASMILHITHDNYPVSNDFTGIINKIASNPGYSQFGMIGFNHLDYRLTRTAIARWKQTGHSQGLMGRAALAKLPFNRNWYDDDLPQSFMDAIDGSPFSVECVSDMGFMINRDLFSRFVSVSDRYRLHLWADDIGMQFLQNNIFNIAMPDVYLFNCQDLKYKYAIVPNSAAAAKKSDNIHFSGYGDHLAYWKEKWGWDREVKDSYLAVREKYKGTLIDQFYMHDNNNGPVKAFAELRMQSSDNDHPN